MAVTPKRMSLAEFLEQPEVKPARELRRGMVSQKMPPSGPHGSIQSWLGAQVYIFGQLREVARAFTVTRLILGGDTYVPDVVVYRWDRIPADQNGRLPFYFVTPPDMVIEILSPGQAVPASLDRCRELVAHGVRVAVLADPERLAVYLVRVDGEIGPLRDDDEIDVTDVMPDLHMTVADLFSQIESRPPKRGV